VIIDRILRFVAWVFGNNKLLGFAKPFCGIRPIIMGEALYQSMSKAL
jgi:hypothetical protein